ncbi:hypothetical protein NDU88_005380 [Pleurodeles waltl]|uniref:Uncharacterized protein n=1 Tax=Pleurodeles waltl TaxID=8319 RepID=A0AAV7RM59_PLEWA|nr:hypothetical protein NDU88_005380 [Pleurodeles waltl]
MSVWGLLLVDGWPRAGDHEYTAVTLGRVRRADAQLIHDNGTLIYDAEDTLTEFADYYTDLFTPRHTYDAEGFTRYFGRLTVA